MTHDKPESPTPSDPIAYLEYLLQHDSPALDPVFNPVDLDENPVDVDAVASFEDVDLLLNLAVPEDANEFLSDGEESEREATPPFEDRNDFIRSLEAGSEGHSDDEEEGDEVSVNDRKRQLEVCSDEVNDDEVRPLKSARKTTVASGVM